VRTVCVVRDAGEERVRAVDMPADVRELIEVAPREKIEAARAALERKPREEGED
jgi:hypothetical protein